MPVSHVCLSSLCGTYRDITWILSKTFKKSTGNPVWLIHPHFSLWHPSGTKNLMLVLCAVVGINLWTKTFMKCLKRTLTIVCNEINKWRFNRLFSCFGCLGFFCMNSIVSIYSISWILIDRKTAPLLPSQSNNTANIHEQKNIVHIYRRGEFVLQMCYTEKIMTEN